MATVTVLLNVVGATGGESVIVPATFQEFLTAASTALGINATRVFSSTGVEIINVLDLFAGQTYYISKGENFYKAIVYFPFKESRINYHVVKIETTDLKGPLNDPNNLSRYETCEGRIKTGIVKEIRRYTFNFSTADFNFAYSNHPLMTIEEGDSQITPGAATIITFPVNQPVTISKEKPRRADPLPDPLPEDPSPWTRRQELYFIRDMTSKRPVIETYNATGQVSFSVYGSFSRALDEAREKIYPKPDLLIGTYRKYHFNGYLWKVQTYTNPTLSGESVLNGTFTEYYNNGNVRVEANFLNNFINGAYREYYYDGLIKCQGILVNGKLQGEYTQWDPLGNRQFKAYYVNGTLNNSYVLDYS